MIFRGMLKIAALLAVVLVAAGCGSVEKAAGPEPAPPEHHLVYEKLIGEKGIWIADVDGSNPRLLVPDPDGYAPVISPDGKWLVYLSDTSYLVSTKAGEKPRRLIAGVDGVTWSPDSKKIVATRSLSDQEDLLTIDVESGKETSLAHGQFLGWSFSPGGQNIVFAMDSGGTVVTTELYVVGVNGGQPRQITKTRDCFDDCTEPVWGLHEIAFARSFFPDNEIDRTEIWGIQPDGSGLRYIARSLRRSSDWDDLSPVEWSADGQALLGVETYGGAGQAVAVDPEHGTVRELAAFGMAPVALSGDGRWALLERELPDAPADYRAVTIASYEGGKASVVATGVDMPSWNR